MRKFEEVGPVQLLAHFWYLNVPGEQALAALASVFYLHPSLRSREVVASPGRIEREGKKVVERRMMGIERPKSYSVEPEANLPSKILHNKFKATSSMQMKGRSSSGLSMDTSDLGRLILRLVPLILQPVIHMPRSSLF